MKKFLLVVLAVLLMAFPMTALADDDASITVVGYGSVAVKPDVARITLGVSNQAETVSEGQNLCNKVIAKIIAALGEAGVPKDNIAVDRLSVYPMYDYSGSVAEQIGYTASHQLIIKTTDLENAGKIIDAALAAGANELSGVEFQLMDDSAAYKEALTLAAKNAADKAETLSAACGKEVGQIESVEEQNNGSYGYYYNAPVAYKATEDNAGGAPTELLAGLLNVTATVTITYNLK